MRDLRIESDRLITRPRSEDGKKNRESTIVLHRPASPIENRVVILIELFLIMAVTGPVAVPRLAGMACTATFGINFCQRIVAGVIVWRTRDPKLFTAPHRDVRASAKASTYA
jgi:hypothetical protein